MSLAAKKHAESEPKQMLLTAVVQPQLAITLPVSNTGNDISVGDDQMGTTPKVELVKGTFLNGPDYTLRGSDIFVYNSPTATGTSLNGQAFLDHIQGLGAIGCPNVGSGIWECACVIDANRTDPQTPNYISAAAIFDANNAGNLGPNDPDPAVIVVKNQSWNPDADTNPTCCP